MVADLGFGVSLWVYEIFVFRVFTGADCDWGGWLFWMGGYWRISAVRYGCNSSICWSIDARRGCHCSEKQYDGDAYCCSFFDFGFIGRSGTVDSFGGERQFGLVNAGADFDQYHDGNLLVVYRGGSEIVYCGTESA